MHAKKNKNILMAIGAVAVIGIAILGSTFSGRIFQGNMDTVIPNAEMCIMIKSFYNAGAWSGKAQLNFNGVEGSDCQALFGVAWWDSITQVAPTPSKDICELMKSYYNAGNWTGKADKNFAYSGADCNNLYGTAWWDSVKTIAPDPSLEICELIKSYYNAGAWTGQADKSFGFSGTDCNNLYGTAWWDSVKTIAPTPSLDVCRAMKSYYNIGRWTGYASKEFGYDGNDCIRLWGSNYWDSVKDQAPKPTLEQCQLIKSYYNAGLWTGQMNNKYAFDGQACIYLYTRAVWDSITEKYKPAAPSPAPTPAPTPTPTPTPTPDPTDGCSKFSDVSKNSNHYEAIEYVRKQGIFTGYSDCTFKPGNSINRAEFTKTLVSAFKVETNVGKSSHFNDVSFGDWFFESVEKAYLKKLVNGYPDSSFRPANLINNAEAAKIFANAAKINVAPYTSDYSYCYNLSMDEKKSWYYPFMAALASQGIISNTCSPTELTTRADVAEMFYHNSL